MGDTAIGQRGPAGELDDVLHMGGAHDPRVVDADVEEQLVELDVLLRQRVEQIMKLQSGDREHRLPIKLGVVESIEQMDAARTGSGDADAEATSPFCIGASIE